MSLPPRPIEALTVAAVLALLAAWALLAIPRARWLAPTPALGWALAIAVALLLAGLSAWVVFVLPAYWD